MTFNEPTRCNVADMVCVVSATLCRHVGMSVVFGGKNPRQDADIASQARGDHGVVVFFRLLFVVVVASSDGWY